MELNLYNMRREFVEFLCNTDTTHLVTFAFNSDACEAKARDRLQEWQKRVDSFALGPRYWKKNDKRIFFVAVPESMGINTHYHALVRWPESKKKTKKIIQHAEELWRDKLVKSGNLDVQKLYDKKGAAKYITKHLRQSVENWLISNEFHAG